MQSGKSVDQGSGIVFGRKLDNNARTNQVGFKEKKNKLFKAHEKVKPKQQLSSRPTKGLVFGPVGGEVEFSSNGKRMRIKEGNLQRSLSCMLKSNSSDEDGQHTSLGNQTVVEASTEVEMYREPTEGGRGDQLI
ncbi:unnamed protein product [Arabis nemorensis]|uniref:Uncharacterized protein n=1 Tax=Arabis nemorensis TaxID=586526 RepID=A0A565AQP5_9BRAS|nr:unnamed protein product [Arabis nemorensis]